MYPSLQPYVSQVRRASVLLLSQPGGATLLPTSYGAAPLCAWQQAQLDPTLDGIFKADDPLYLLLALAKKFRFVDAHALAALEARLNEQHHAVLKRLETLAARIDELKAA